MPGSDDGSSAELRAALEESRTENQRLRRALEAFTGPEAQERERRAWFAALLDESPVAVSMAEDGITTYGNAEYRRLFGVGSPAEILGHPLLEQVAPEAQPAMLARIESRRRGVVLAPEFETIGLRKDGTRFNDLITTKALPLPSGRVVVAFHQDITERRRTEQALRASEERLRRVAAHLPVFVMELSLDGRLQYINRVLPHLDPDQVLGRDWLDFIPPGERARAAALFARLLERRSPSCSRSRTPGASWPRRSSPRACARASWCGGSSPLRGARSLRGGWSGSRWWWPMRSSCCTPRCPRA